MFARAFAVVAYLIGLGGAGVFFVYILDTGTGAGYWPYGGVKTQYQSISFNLALLILFACQHSGMARRSFSKHFGFLARSIYVAASGIVIAGLTVAWQPLHGEPVWHGPPWIVAISLLGALGIAACCRWFDHNTFFGLTQAWTGNADVHGSLCIEGPYRYVRHPLMLAFLIAIWAQPVMPPELLMLNVGMTIYVLLAIRLEERDLVREFGKAYEEYRRNVAGLIPFVW